MFPTASMFPLPPRGGESEMSTLLTVPVRNNELDEIKK